MRLSPEREEEIRYMVRNGSYGHPCDWFNHYKELLAEIDRLRAEFETAAMKCNDYQMRAYKLSEENENLKKCLFQMQEAAKDLVQENARMREALEKINNTYIAEARQNDWSKCCELQDIAREASDIKYVSNDTYEELLKIEKEVDEMEVTNIEDTLHRGIARLTAIINHQLRTTYVEK